MLWSFIKFLNTFFKEMYGDQFGEFVCGYWGLKGISQDRFKWLLSTQNQQWLQGAKKVGFTAYHFGKL